MNDTGLQRPCESTRNGRIPICRGCGKYGTQRAWRRKAVNSHGDSSDGFEPVPEQMQLPFVEENVKKCVNIIKE
jgi:hypothetical protein